MSSSMTRVQLSYANLTGNTEDDVNSNRRRPGRLRCERLRCSGGFVADLSTTGAKLRLKSWSAPQEGTNRTLVFTAAFGETEPFPCVIQWVRKQGRFKYEVGVQFLDLDEKRKRILAEIARVHAGRTQLRDLTEAA